MTVRRALVRKPARDRLAAFSATALLATAALAGCSSDGGDGPLARGVDGEGNGQGTGQAEKQVKTVSEARLRTNLPAGRAKVTVDTLLEVSATNGTLEKVAFTTGKRSLAGKLSRDSGRWTAADRLEPGRDYRVSAVAVDGDGLQRKIERTFRTVPLTLDQQTYPSIAPLAGETVGVGMPVILTFDVPVTDRPEIEKHLSVDTAPAQPGSWHWISDNEVHWRPKSYWQPGTDVTVHADVNGVNAGNGIYGQEDRTTKFRIGDAVVMKVDVASHRMRVLNNGKLLRTIPISAGKPGFTTRSGVKVIIEKFRYKTMDAATTGISEDDPEYYNISDVEYAQRVTYSGEFLHAAPWSVGSQGAANVSHGCVGMSTADAGWLYSVTRRGDVVEVTGSDRPMEATNGYGDWNVSWSDYKTGSALD